MKIIFLTGGVYSSIGKGIILSAIGKILQFEGYKCNVLKFDPYLNYNSKFLSPLQHGEVFVTKDGEETDLDLGHYERFLGIELNSHSCFTTGKIFSEILEKERRGEYNGETVQIVPHLTEEIISKIEYFKQLKTEILLVELGGTVNDLEQKPFLLAASEMSRKKNQNEMIFIHIAPLIKLHHNLELKTKPIQHSILSLKESGITPDILILKGEESISEREKRKINLNFPNIKIENIFSSPYNMNIFKIPIYLYREEKLSKKILSLFNLKPKDLESSPINHQLIQWEDFNKLIESRKKYSLKILIIGKYSSSPEAYYSIIKSFEYASYLLSIQIKVEIIEADKLMDTYPLESAQVICIPHGFGSKGIEGKLKAIQFAREKKIPFLGICFGMQLAILEYYRNVLNISHASSVEHNLNSSFPILIPWTKELKMRLGEIKFQVVKHSLLYRIYRSEYYKARHRHRYIFNIDLAEKEGSLKTSDLMISAISSGVVESIELKNHPFFLGVQYHPEFSSKPHSPEPIFLHILNTALSINYPNYKIQENV